MEIETTAAAAPIVINNKERERSWVSELPGKKRKTDEKQISEEDFGEWVDEETYRLAIEKLNEEYDDFGFIDDEKLRDEARAYHQRRIDNPFDIDEVPPPPIPDCFEEIWPVNPSSWRWERAKELMHYAVETEQGKKGWNLSDLNLVKANKLQCHYYITFEAKHDQEYSTYQTTVCDDIGYGSIDVEIFQRKAIEQAKESGGVHVGAETHHPAAGNVGKFEMKGVEEQDVGKEMRRTTAEMGGGGADVSQYRQAAQQNSIDALRAAEERYNKAKGAEGKDSVKQTSQSSRDNLMQGAQNTSQVAAEKGAQTKDSLMQGAQRTSQVAAEKGAQAKDNLMQGAQSTTQIAAEKGAQAKDSLMQGAQRTTQYASAKGGELKDTAIQKGQPLYETTRDTVAGAGKTAADYTWKAKDVVAEKAVGAKDVVAEKAVGAKDVVVESGKGTAGYVGGVATTVKDKAVVAGWGAAEYTAEKVVGATKAVANVTAGAAGYVGGTAVAAKDMVGSAGVSAKDYAAQKLAAAKDAVVASEESAKDYASRKRAEAEKNMQAKQAAESKGEVWSSPTEEEHDIAGAGRQAVEAAKETISKPVEKAGEFFQQEQQSEYGSRQPGQSTAAGEGAGVFNAIGETIVEIGQTTKDMLVGKGQTPATTTVKDSAADQNK